MISEPTSKRTHNSRRKNNAFWPIKLFCAAQIALLTKERLSLVKAEEQSILSSATVSSSLKTTTPDGDVLLNGSFKSSIKTQERNNPLDIEINNLDLPNQEKVVTVIIMADTQEPDRIGDSQILLAKDGGVEVLAKSSVYDTGIYTLDSPGEATSIIIRRVAEGSNVAFKLSHVRAYQCKNLLSLVATIHYQTHYENGNGAQNLIDNPESRSSSNMKNAKFDALFNGIEVTHKSCYRTNSTNIKNDGDQMKLVFDFQVRHFIHAIFLADDFIDQFAWTYFSAIQKMSYLQNLSFYVGDDPNNAQNNQLCPGGPFLKIDDPTNYKDDPNTKNTDLIKPWKYGQEVWCNMEGRYLHVIANLSHQSGAEFNQTICTLGVFGTIYTRSIDLAQKIVTIPGQQTLTITVPHIQAHPSLPIGNILSINIREKSSLNTSIVRTSSESSLTVFTAEFVDGTSHDLVIESFDDNSSLKSTLRTDTIKIIVPEYLRNYELPYEIVAVQGQKITIIVPHIYANPNIDTLDINVREKSSLNVQISHTSTESVLNLDISQLVTGTSYDLVLESFDDNSSTKSTLKTDTIEIILPKIEPLSQPPVFKLGKQSIWLLPNTNNEATVKFSLDSQIASLFRFVPSTRSIIFNGQDFKIEVAQVGQVFSGTIILNDEYSNVFIQTIEIELLQEHTEQNSESTNIEVVEEESKTKDLDVSDIEAQTDDSDNLPDNSEIKEKKEEIQDEIVQEPIDEIVIIELQNELEKSMNDSGGNIDKAIGQVLSIPNVEKAISNSMKVVQQENINTFDINKFFAEKEKDYNSLSKQDIPPLIFAEQMKETFCLPGVATISFDGNFKIQMSTEIKKQSFVDLLYYLQQDIKIQSTTRRNLTSSVTDDQTKTENEKTIQDSDNELERIQSLLQATNSVVIDVITNNDHEMKSFAWKLTEYDEKGLSIQIIFNNPDYVSIIEPDILKVTLRNANYFLRPKDELKQTVPNEFSTQATLLPQSYSLPSKKTVEATKESSEAFVVINVIISFVYKNLAQIMFGSILSLQILAHLPLANIQLPANSVQTFVIMAEIVSFDYFEIHEFVNFKFSPTKPWSTNFEKLGYFTTNFIEGMGSILVFILIGTPIIILTVILSQFKIRCPLKFCRHLCQPIKAWQSAINFLQGTLFPIFLCVSISMNSLKIFEFMNRSDKLSVALHMAILVITIAFCLLVIYDAIFLMPKVQASYTLKKKRQNKKLLISIEQKFKEKEKDDIVRSIKQMKNLRKSYINQLQRSLSLQVDSVIKETKSVNLKLEKKAANLTKMHRELFQPFHQGLRKSSKMAMMITFFQLLRQIILLYSAMFFSRHPWLQVLLFMSLSLISLLYLGNTMPYKDKIRNVMQLINGTATLIVSYMLMVVNGLSTGTTEHSHVEQIQLAGLIITYTLRVTGMFNILVTVYLMVNQLYRCSRKRILKKRHIKNIERRNQQPTKILSTLKQQLPKQATQDQAIVSRKIQLQEIQEVESYHEEDYYSCDSNSHSSDEDQSEQKQVKFPCLLISQFAQIDYADQNSPKTRPSEDKIFTAPFGTPERQAKSSKNNNSSLLFDQDEEIKHQNYRSNRYQPETSGEEWDPQEILRNIQMLKKQEDEEAENRISPSTQYRDNEQNIRKIAPQIKLNNLVLKFIL